MTTYTGANIQDLESIHPLEPIRRLPGMYIGNNGVYGLHHLVFEAIDNSIDEILNGYGRQVSVTIHPDGSLSVEDDGRGIPVDYNPQARMSALTLALTKRHAGGKFRQEGQQDAYLSGSGGLHGIGIKATNAFSEWLVVEVRRHGFTFRQRFEQGGTPVTPVEIDNLGRIIGQVDARTDWQVDKKSGLATKLTVNKKPVVIKPDPKLGSGTKLHFQPHRPWFDRTMDWPTGSVPWDFTRLETRLQQLAHLHPGVRIELADLRGHRKDHKHRLFESKNGLVDYVAELNDGLAVLHKPIRFSGSQDVTAAVGENGSARTETLGKIGVEVVLQYASDDTSIISFVNSIPTPQGGTAVSGFQSGLTRAVNQFGGDKKLLKRGNVKGDDLLLGLTAIINVTMTLTPQFSSQTKEQLTTSEAQGIAASITYENLLAYLNKNIPVGKTIIAQAEAAARGREAAKAARALVIRKSALEVSELPGKLADVARDTPREKTMLFIVEGDSAGGSCKQGRDRRYHAILPLRGKIANTEALPLTKMIGDKGGNAEIKALVSAIGGGIGRDFEAAGMRYGGVAILTDADVDGAHIRTLLLTFFWRHMRAMVEAGRLYIATPPLYRLAKGKQTQYAYTDEEKDELLAKWGDGATVQRYKGLGEMNPDQLRETVFALKGGEVLNDHLLQVQVEDPHHAGRVMGTLMGKAVEPRRVWLFKTWAGEAEAVDSADDVEAGEE
ncbi:MAG: DNA topoisomerase 4 subunit B [Anaerolineae bacterium]|nr:DNA topoisomerase 4 subunit B [Anaerolineae bacterium]